MPSEDYVDHEVFPVRISQANYHLLSFIQSRFGELPDDVLNDILQSGLEIYLLVHLQAEHPEKKEARSGK